MRPFKFHRFVCNHLPSTVAVYCGVKTMHVAQIIYDACSGEGTTWKKGATTSQFAECGAMVVLECYGPIHGQTICTTQAVAQTV